jgi:hypothetical protein
MKAIDRDLFMFSAGMIFVGLLQWVAAHVQ